MWPFSTRQERQAAEMAQILAENSYEIDTTGFSLGYGIPLRNKNGFIHLFLSVM